MAKEKDMLNKILFKIFGVFELIKMPEYRETIQEFVKAKEN